MNKYALDSSAVLAVIQEEPGADYVKKILDDCVVSAVNISEIVGKLTDNGIREEHVRIILKDAVREIVAFDEDIAFLAGAMKSKTQSFGLSLGDRACLATAEYLGLEAVTADKIWAKLKLPVKIKIIR